MGAIFHRAAAEKSLDEQSSTTSFLSRLAFPLRSRSRNLADFHVRPDDPHRHYAAGDHVTGSVVLSVIKPIRITHLTVALHGYVRVSKNAAAATQLNSIPTIVPYDGSKKLKYYGNGHACLFQDEQVLCGEGRLTPRRFEFKFDLIFPPDGLPSSIDFERGTISYVITATLTRPTTIAPTTSCERKLWFVEQTDVGLLSPPRQRKVTMHALHRRHRRTKLAATVNDSIDTPGPSSDRDRSKEVESLKDSHVSPNDNVQVGSDAGGGRSPNHSDYQSEFSGESVTTSSSAKAAEASSASATGSKASGMEDREITATVELLRGGCLPGDTLPLKISVDHNRRMKSMHGIIVTFYRQGRVDYAPPISRFTGLSEEDARRLRRDEYYPKSKTGLGGLSLSSAGSCSVFRKDLSQSVAPIIIDPLTLSASITTSVRVPEDVFPTIKSVPGGLLSFKYNVEVVVDLGGRLAGQSQGTPQAPGRLGSLSLPGAGTSAAASSKDGLSRLGNWNGTIVDTDQLRREKGVISVSFEVVVGTSDSSRARGKAVLRPGLSLQSPSCRKIPVEIDYEPNNANNAWPNGPDEQHGPRYTDGMAASLYDIYEAEQVRAPVYVPPPQLPDASVLSEKDRARQAEQLLLPSQPSPQVAGFGSAAAAPSAADIRVGEAPGSAARSTMGPASDVSSVAGPSAPTLEAVSATWPNPTEDKQDLERRRLLQEASAPPEVPDDYAIGEASAPPCTLSMLSKGLEPSAPVLEEEDGYGPQDTESVAPISSCGHCAVTDVLPKYLR